MTYLFPKPAADQSDGRTSMAFRLTAAILAGAAVLLFYLVAVDAGLAGPVPWIVAALAAGSAFMLAPFLIAVIMVVVAPVLVIAVLVRFLTS